jgi:hypothetical protein
MSDRTELARRDRLPVLGMLNARSQTSADRFTGLFGLWAWPLVNLILAIAESKRAPAQTTVQRRRMSIWDVTRDKEGRIISILEREVGEE